MLPPARIRVASENESQLGYGVPGTRFEFVALRVRGDRIAVPVENNRVSQNDGEETEFSVVAQGWDLLVSAQSSKTGSFPAIGRKVNARELHCEAKAARS